MIIFLKNNNNKQTEKHKKKTHIKSIKSHLLNVHLREEKLSLEP